MPFALIQSDIKQDRGTKVKGKTCFSFWQEEIGFVHLMNAVYFSQCTTKATRLQLTVNFAVDFAEIHINCNLGFQQAKTPSRILEHPELRDP